jgi:nitrile hydratase accessory protein
MQTRFEQFALTTMMGCEDAPPRLNGRLSFREEWERQAFGFALALSKSGHFDWEDFRQELIKSIDEWEKRHAIDDLSWSYYDRWLTALERVLIKQEILTLQDLSERGAGRGIS